MEDHHLVFIDSLAHTTEVTVIDKNHFTKVIEACATKNILVIPVHCKTPERRSLPPTFCSCVETVKRILGLHCPFILTPWQLFKHLIKEDQKWEV